MFVAQVIGDRGCLKIVGGEEKEGEKGGKHEKRDGKACSWSQNPSITDKFYLHLFSLCIPLTFYVLNSQRLCALSSSLRISRF